MQIDVPEEIVIITKSLVTAFLAEDLEAVESLLDDHPDPLLVMALASLSAAVVRAFAVNNGHDPTELWALAMYQLATKE